MKLTGKQLSTFFLFPLIFIFLNIGVKAAVFTVTNLNDSGEGSLRQAILKSGNSPGDNAIDFQAGLAGTINLESTMPAMTFPVTINGPGVDVITVRRNPMSSEFFRIFLVTAPLDRPLVINGLTIAGGVAPNSSNDPEVSVRLGGGIKNDGGLVLNNCRLSGNSAFAAVAEGGAIRNTGWLTVTNSEIVGNSVGQSGNPIGHAYGAGIYNLLGRITIENTTFSGSSGSTAVFNEGVATIRQSTIANNSGGGIITASLTFNGNQTTLFLENSTVSGNTSAVSCFFGAALQIKSSTIANNTGVGVRTQNCGAADSSAVRLDNSIVAGNGNGSNPDLIATFSADSGYNLVGDGSQGNLVNGANGNIVGTSGAPVNPQLAPLGNYGGRTQTHRLLYTSPAINAGNPTEFPATDQRGVQRPVGGRRADIGAFEFNLTPHRFLPRGGLNAVYNQTLTAFSDAPEPVFTFAVTEGSLPPGISLSQSKSNRAILTGIPNAVGTFSFTITATTTGGFTISASYSLTIQNAVSFVAVRGRVLTNDGKPVRRAVVTVFDADGNVIKQSFTNPFGYYRFKDVQAGEAYSFNVAAKNRRFTPQQNIVVNGELNGFNFIAEP